jgi:hypothetical protein
MLHEYAVEPELVGSWCDRTSGRYFFDKFGLGSPRIMSRYPRKRWKKLVWEAWKKRSSYDDSARKRMEELIQRLSEVVVMRRDAIWRPDRTWLDNAVEEHERIPFHAIVARSNPSAHPKVLVADTLDERPALWNKPHGMLVSRTADGISDSVRDMLRAACKIVFVDPYFSPSPDRGYVEVLAACLRSCLKQRIPDTPPRIRIFTSNGSERDRGCEPRFFESECRGRLPARLPSGQRVTISCLKERFKGERLHNRYILTELGGVSLGAGLDERSGAATDDIFVLTRELYEKRWQQYVREPRAFDQPGTEIVVVGTGRP